MRIADTFFTRDDGKPLFWLADTAWNTALRADEPAWHDYLSLRARQGFTVIQFVATQWRGCSAPLAGVTYSIKDGELIINEAALAHLDRWIALIREYGMVPAPVMLWANTPTCPGQTLSEEHCITLGRHMLQRWGDGEIVWILAGDGNYESPEAVERWSAIGRGIFADAPEQIVTMHPCGLSWVGDSFAAEPWYSFVGIQSGHGSRPQDLEFLLQGDYSSAWRRIAKPFINLEPNYEFAYGYGGGRQFTDYAVRRASYWSLLQAPTAGITYGNNAIWVWAATEGEHAEGHSDFWVAPQWRQGLETPGIASMSVMVDIMDKLPWPQLRPAPELLALQPGESALETWVSLARTPAGLLVAYLPLGGQLELVATAAPAGARIHRVDPRTGEWITQDTLSAPTGEDWLLVIGQVD